MKTYIVNVSGYYQFDSFSRLNESGVYLVYRQNKNDGRFRLIYIGKADVVSNRVNEQHNHYQDWLEWAYGDVSALRFSIVTVPEGLSIEDCEAALIYALQPPINTDGKETYARNDIEIMFVGRPVCNRESIIAIRNA